MKRLEIIEKLHELENRKRKFEALRKDHSSYYQKETVITACISTTDYNSEYNNESISVNKQLFDDYLDNEIVSLEDRIKELISDLTES